jgi:hypothetical protein
MPGAASVKAVPGILICSYASLRNHVLLVWLFLSVLQGDMDHASRDRVVNEFRRGETKILIATDVLARGFDVSQVRVLRWGLVDRRWLLGCTSSDLDHGAPAAVSCL